MPCWVPGLRVTPGNRIISIVTNTPIKPYSQVIESLVLLTSDGMRRYDELIRKQK